MAFLSSGEAGNGTPRVNSLPRTVSAAITRQRRTGKTEREEQRTNEGGLNDNLLEAVESVILDGEKGDHVSLAGSARDSFGDGDGRALFGDGVEGAGKGRVLRRDLRGSLRVRVCEKMTVSMENRQNKRLEDRRKGEKRTVIHCVSAKLLDEREVLG
jgi:hypothetical protein